ncbi:protein MpRLK-Pelle_L-LEC12 [Marchantia polymorpha subsp. ruderalis]
MTHVYYSPSAGVALSRIQIPLQKSESDPTRTSISFSTSFRFTIEPSDPNYRGDGMAFVMLSEGLQGSYGGAFGVFDGHGHRIARTLAIEFDTFENSAFGDKNNNHVGVDIQDINSTIARSAWEVSIDLAGSYSIYSWIDYNSSAQKLEVRISSDYAKPSLPFIVFALNLFDVFHPDELVYVGFSAANGVCVCFNFYTVHDWTFSYVSEPDAIIQVSPPILPAPTPEPGGEFKVLVALIAGVSLGVVLLFSILVIVGLVIRQKKSNRPEVGLVLRQKKANRPEEFSFEHLCIATDQFREEAKLGQGAFGAVYRGQLPDTGQLVAVKRLNSVSNEGLKGFMAEVSIISQIRHRNIVKLLGWCNDRGNLLLVYELMPNGSLDKALFHPANPESVLPWKLRFKIISGSADALYYLHEGWRQQVIHRDFKSSNIMLDQDFNAMLGDFGLARMADHSQSPATTQTAGTFGYIAPEVAGSGKFTDKADVYAFGAVALVIACGRPAFLFKAPVEQIFLVDWVWEKLDQESLFDVVDPRLGEEFDAKEMKLLLLLGLLCSHPNAGSRPTMREVVEILGGRVALPLVPSSKPQPHYLSSVATDQHQSI